MTSSFRFILLGPVIVRTGKDELLDFWISSKRKPLIAAVKGKRAALGPVRLEGYHGIDVEIFCSVFRALWKEICNRGWGLASKLKKCDRPGRA